MKVFHFFIFFFLFLFACVSKKKLELPEILDPGKELVTKNNYLWVFKPSVNVRENDAIDSRLVDQIVDGDSALVLTNKNGWYHIRTEDDKTGWIRSDLLGPKNLSAFRRAVSFAQDLKEKDKTELFFDKKLFHKRIYITYPSKAYNSSKEIEIKTNELLEEYQEKVYRGEITVRILKPGTDKEYLTKVYKGDKNADPVLPKIPFGFIQTVDRNDPLTITLSYSIPAEISNQELLETARHIASTFPLSYQCVEINFTDPHSSNNKNCRLWFREDQSGEEFAFNKCP
jgi:hypothetical protein